MLHHVCQHTPSPHPPTCEVTRASLTNSVLMILRCITCRGAELQPLHHLHQVLLRHHLNNTSAQVAGGCSIVGLGVVKHGRIHSLNSLLCVLQKRHVGALVPRGRGSDSSTGSCLLLLLLRCGCCCGVSH